MAVQKVGTNIIDSSYTTAITTNPVFSGTGSITVPAGTTAQRPASPTVGMVRYNTETVCLEQYTSNGWVAIAAPPTITTVSPTTYSGESGTTFTINGTSFDASPTVKFIDNAGVEYSAGSVTRISTSQLTATTPQDFTVAQEPLKVKVTNSSGLTYTLDNAIDCGGVPTWTTASGNLATIIEGVAMSTVTLQAGDPDAGATITFGITSGSLPTGVTLNTSSGAITGTSTAGGTYASGGTTYNITVNATDNAGNSTSRAFNIIRKWKDGSTSAQAATSAYHILSLGAQHATDGSAQKYYIALPTGTAQIWCKFTGDSYAWMLATSFGGTNSFSDGCINSARFYTTESTIENAPSSYIRYQKEDGTWATNENGTQMYWAFYPDSVDENPAINPSLKWWAHSGNLGRMYGPYGDMSGRFPSNTTHGLWKAYVNDAGTQGQDKIFNHDGTLVYTYNNVQTVNPNSARFTLGPLSNTTHGYYQEGTGSTTKHFELWVGSAS